MIGCSESPSATRYHWAAWWDASWAFCEAIWLHQTWQDGEEPALRLAFPHLTRCPRCFGKEAE